MLNAAISYDLTTTQKNSIELTRDTLVTTIESKEQYLLESIVQGNSQAFWPLWLLYEKYLYRRCQMWMGGNEIEAEEALSQARLKAWEKLPNYASKITNPKAWLTRMTHNLCVDLHRKRQRSANNTDSIEEMALADTNILASNSDSPELVILNDELKICIQQAINSLPPRLRDVWSLLYYSQMCIADIAQRLMLSKDNVYKRIQQGRIILQKQLNKYFSGENISLKNKLGTEKISKKSQQDQVSKSSSTKVLNILLSPHSCSTKVCHQTNKNRYQEYPIEVINYQVTALCLDTLSLAL